jgi:hypothetical protein
VGSTAVLLARLRFCRKNRLDYSSWNKQGLRGVWIDLLKENLQQCCVAEATLLLSGLCKESTLEKSVRNIARYQSGVREPRSEIKWMLAVARP